MNSLYWRKILIKFSNPTNSVYNFNNNVSETEKSRIKTTLLSRQGILAGDHVVKQAMWGKGLKACWYMSMWARKARWDVST